MLKADFTNINEISKVDVDDLRKQAEAAHRQLLEWRKTQDALFYDIVFDDLGLNYINQKAKEVATRFENIVVLGIGGSSLGLRSSIQALLPPFWNLKDRKTRKNNPKIFICDNVDPETFSGLLDLVEMKETCFVVISKSGKTTETAAQFFVMRDRLKKTVGSKWHEHLVIITDPQSGELRPIVEKEKILSFAIPPKLGGRFSVLSPVGLFPAACVGIDINNLLEGAKAMAKRCETSKFDDNIAYKIGGYHYHLDTKKQKSISVMMPYSDALMLLSDWHAQLWAESLGKNGKGQTPVKALGATDQHSQIQLYMEGPHDKIITFLTTEQFRTSKTSTIIENPDEYFNYLKGHDFGTILNAEQKATAFALTQVGQQNLTITFPTIDEYHLGEFFMLYEIATTFAGALYRVNPFDQPGVELGKKLTKEILER